MAQNAMATKAEESPDAVHPERMHEGVQYAPRVDILETENEIAIYADMPGCKPEDVDVEFEMANWSSLENARRGRTIFIISYASTASVTTTGPSRSASRSTSPA